MDGNKTCHPNTDSLPYRGIPAAMGYSTARYGLMVHSLNGNTYLGEAGGYPGMNADVELCNDSKYVFVVLADVDPPVAQRLAHSVFKNVISASLSAGLRSLKS